jgi:glycosyltransferase involved in cell wall biosynthesis
MTHKVLFFVEGFTDIRFVVGLSRICDLTMAVPLGAYRASGLKGRVEESGAALEVVEIPGGRLAFQLRSLRFLWSRIREFDLVLSQEMLRGSLNATAVGALRGVPVAATLAIDPPTYFRCRHERGQIGSLTAALGDGVIRVLMTVNGRLATRVLALGPYLQKVARRYSDSVDEAFYYGVDTSLFRPADGEERAALRERLELPAGRFLVLSASRVSHEKDPETVLRACAMARGRGVDLALLNLGGGHADFLRLASDLGIHPSEGWVAALPAVHPMRDLADYVRAADLLAQASLAEGLGLAPLEALACGTPVVATAVGGMALALDGYARLTPRRDPAAMSEEILWVTAHTEEARAQARRGRAHVVEAWDRERAFGGLARQFEPLVASRPRGAACRAPDPSPIAEPGRIGPNGEPSDQ